MVIHDEGETPMEVSVIRKPLFEPKTYVFVENHVRELTNNVENKPSVCLSEEKSPSTLESNTMVKVKKSSKKGKRKGASSTECDANTQNKDTEISKSDLEELKTVYEQCRSVVAKIEKKYGHLLNVHEEAGASNSQQRKRALDCEEYEEEHECQCTMNTKLKFDDDGQQIQIDSQQDTHICPKKLKKTQNNINNHNIQVEFTENEIKLPENIQELANILEKPDVEITYRNKVIDKVKAIRQEYLNEIRFNKHALVEKLKTNSDELLDFRGTNLSSLPGYL